MTWSVRSRQEIDGELARDSHNRFLARGPGGERSRGEEVTPLLDGAVLQLVAAR